MSVAWLLVVWSSVLLLALSCRRVYLFEEAQQINVSSQLTMHHEKGQTNKPNAWKLSQVHLAMYMMVPLIVPFSLFGFPYALRPPHIFIFSPPHIPHTPQPDGKGGLLASAAASKHTVHQAVRQSRKWLPQ